MFNVRGGRVRARLIGSAAVLALCAGAARAQTTDISLPSQPLSESLIAVAKKTGESIIFSQQSLKGIQAPALNGQMSAQQAVQMLIKGTNLEIASVGNDGLVVRAASQKRSDASRPQVQLAENNDDSGRPALLDDRVNVQELVPSQDVQVAQAAPVQPPAPQNEAGVSETVEVSASRISIAGYEAPTPVTVIGAEQLLRDAKTDIADAIRQLPEFGGSTSPNNSVQSGLVGLGNAGLDELSLRNLGALRTLVLFDGQRVVAGNIADGAVDITNIPSTLITRVDVVTGGASASWGSDAVAGVVNLILNKNYDGFRVDAEGSDNFDLTHETYKFDVTYGTSFDGGRAHIILSGSYLDSPQPFFDDEAPWFKATKLVNNPAYAPGNGQSQLIHANDVGLAEATQGGLITSGPLKGTQFVGPSGTPAPFSFGNVSGGAISNGGSAETSVDDLSMIAVPLRNQTAFAYGSYKLTDNIMASLQLNYGGSSVVNTSAAKVNSGNLTINAGNPYIPASIAAAMTAQGIKSFSFGSTNTNNLTSLTDNNLGAIDQSLGVPLARTDRQLLRGVASLDGTIGDDWSWTAYYEHGETRASQTLLNNVETANYNNALNAVQVTATNVGTSGLPIGSIQCASTLTSPTNGCVPLDVFGNGVASSAAINYIDGVARNGGDHEDTTLNQDVAAGSMQGTLPWGLPAGRMALAFGAEYRKEGGRETASALAAATVFNVGNFSNFAGEYNVEEGFAELSVPLLKNDIVESLDLDTAGRLTDYSTSGLVETWKLGLNSQVNDDFRLRSTWSFDIRAPDLYELFNSGLYSLSSATDPKTGINEVIYNYRSGNPNLIPEQSTTVSGGVVLTPHWIDGLTFSADWYSIGIKKAIVTLSLVQVVANCKAGQALYCSQLVYGGPGGVLSQVNTSPLNANAQSASGVDFQSDYSTGFLSGQLNFHLVGNYTDEQTQTAGGVKYDYAGSLSGDSIIEGVPKFKATLSGTYIEGKWQGTVQGRFIGAASLVNGWGPSMVDNNNVSPVGYLDLRASYNWTDYLQLYGAIDNTLDAAPPSVATSSNAGTGGDGTRDDIYDAFGRVFRIGLRVTY